MQLYRYNSYYELTNVIQHSPVYNKIDYVFSCFNFKTKERYGRLYLNIGSTVRIPSTVSEEFMWDLFNLRAIDKRTEMEPQEEFFTMINKPRNDLQERAIKFLTEDDNNHKVLSLNTSAGKTYVTINAISRMKQNSIVLVDTLSLADQWREEFIKHTGSDSVQIIDANKIENDLVEDKKLYIITQQSIDSLMLRDFNSLNRLIEEKQIGLKIFDESHTRFHDLSRINCIFDTAKTIYLTATFDRNYTEVKQWKEIFSGVSKLIDKSEDRYRRVYLTRFTTGPSPTEYETNYVVGLRGASATLWAKYLTRKEKKLRRNILIPVVENIIDHFEIDATKEHPLCVILPTNEIAANMADHFRKKGYETGLYNSEQSKLVGGSSVIFDNDIIFTNNVMFSKGIDVPKLKYLMNFASASSAIAVEQVVGRLRGSVDEDDKIYIDCVDKSFGEAAFVRQQKLRRTYYRKITTDADLLKEENVYHVEI